MGPSRRGRRQPVPAALHRDAGEEGQGLRAARRAQERRRAPARHGPRPRGRGHRLAPARHAQAEGAGPPDGLPRDHRARDPRRRREPARPRPGPRRRPGDPPHPGPPLRLRGLPRAVEEGHAAALGGPGAVGGDADHRAARARADARSSRPGTGTSPRRWTPGPTRRRARSAPGSSPSTATGSPRAATSVPTGSCAAPATRLRGCSTRAAPAASPRRCTGATWPSPRSSRGPTRASRTRRS